MSEGRGPRGRPAARVWLGFGSRSAILPAPPWWWFGIGSTKHTPGPSLGHRRTHASHQTVPLFPFRGDVNPGCGCVSSSGFTGRMAVFCLFCPRFCRSSHVPADAGKLCQRRARVPILYARFRRRSANATSRSTAGDR